MQPSAADPEQSAVLNLVDARFVLEDHVARDAWAQLLSLLGAVVGAQGSRRALPDMVHTRVLAFLSEWSDLFAPATARHPPFQSAFDEFRRAWEAQPSRPPSPHQRSSALSSPHQPHQQPSHPSSPHERRTERAPSPVRRSLSTALGALDEIATVPTTARASLASPACSLYHDAHDDALQAEAGAQHDAFATLHPLDPRRTPLEALGTAPGAPAGDGGTSPGHEQTVSAGVTSSGGTPYSTPGRRRQTRWPTEDRSAHDSAMDLLDVAPNTAPEMRVETPPSPATTTYYDAAETLSSSTHPPPEAARVNEGVNEGVHEGVHEEDPVAMLMAMGFPEAAVVEELRLNRGDPDRAAQFLWAQVSAALLATLIASLIASLIAAQFLWAQVSTALIATLIASLMAS